MKNAWLVFFLVPAVFAAEPPGPEKLRGPVFEKGFSAYSKQVFPGPESALMSRDEVNKFVGDLLAVPGRDGVLSEAGLKTLETNARGFLAYPYSATAGFGFHTSLTEFVTAYRLKYVGLPSVPQETVDFLGKASYLTSMRDRLARHVAALARAADWDRARSSYPGGGKKFDRDLSRSAGK
jgi:hypothetical protein